SELVTGLKYKLQANETLTLTFKVNVKADLDTTKVTKIANKATVGDQSPTIEIPTGKTTFTTTKKVADASGDNIASPGEELTYTITTTNEGTVTAKNVVIKDMLTTVLPHVDNPRGNSVSIKVGSSMRTATVQELIDGITIPEIKGNETVTIVFKVKVKADLDVTTVKEIVNKVVVNGTDTETKIPTGTTDLSTSKTVSDASGDNIAAPGEELTYVITAKNNGSAESEELTLKDELTNVLGNVDESAASIVVTVKSDKDAAKNRTVSGSELVTGLKYKLQANETLTLTFKVTVKADLDTTKVTKIANTATIGDQSPTIEIPTGISQISSTKTVSDANNDKYASPGEELMYTITATNNGTVTSDTVTIKDTMALALPHVNEEAAAIVVTVTSNKDATKNATVTGAQLAAGLNYKLLAGETIAVSFKVTVKNDLDVSKVKEIANTATIGDTTPSITIPTGKSDISSTKTVKEENNDGLASPGEKLTYTITGTNNGSVTAKDVTFKDELTGLLGNIAESKESIVVKVSSNKDSGKNTSLTGTELVNGITYNLLAEETVTITFTVTVSDNLDTDTVKNLANKALVGGTTPEIVIPTGSSKLSSSKTVSDASGDGFASPSEKLRYVITVSNTGSVGANNVEVKDEMTSLIDNINELPQDINVQVRSTKDSSKNGAVSGKQLREGLAYNLASNETITLTFEVTVKDDLDVEKVKKIANKATVSGTTDPEVEIETGEADLYASKVVTDENGDGFVSKAEKLTYILTAKNGGSVEMKDVFVQDKLDKVLPYIEENASQIQVKVSSDLDSSKDKLIDANELINGLSFTIEANETITIEFVVTAASDIDEDAIGSIANKATVGDQNPEANIDVEKNLYRIYYHGNGYEGEGLPVDEVQYVTTDAVLIRGFMTRSFSLDTFVEWNTSPDGTGKAYKVGDSTNFNEFKSLGLVSAERSVTLYAIWKKQEIPPVITKPAEAPKSPSAPATGDVLRNYGLIIGFSIVMLYEWKKRRYRRFQQRSK
ncbi:hypothetical protein, partial [Breznakia sp. PH5-24]